MTKIYFQACVRLQRTVGPWRGDGKGPRISGDNRIYTGEG